MAISRHTKVEAVQVLAEVPEAAIVEPGANEAEAVPLTAADWADAIEWEYSATAEDNGTAGILDGEPGLIYRGEGTAVQVRVANFDTLEHGITPPEATDKAVLAVYKNSDVVAYADEGLNTHAAEIAVEGNLDTYVTLSENDVLRVGVAFTGEEADADLDLAPGEVSVN